MKEYLSLLVVRFATSVLPGGKLSTVCNEPSGIKAKHNKQDCITAQYKYESSNIFRIQSTIGGDNRRQYHHADKYSEFAFCQIESEHLS